jgi:mercuric ion transport protein
MTWRTTSRTVPGLGISLMPKVVCPICSPAYAALLSSVGLGFLGSTMYLLPLTVTCLALALGSLFWRASSRRGFGPFALAVVAAACVLIGKFWRDSPVTVYMGVDLLLMGSIWNAVPNRTAPSFCPSCLRTELGVTHGKATEG